MSDDLGRLEDEEIPDEGAMHVFHVMAQEAFMRTATALALDDMDAARQETERYMNQFHDLNENPFEHLTRMSTMFNAVLVRTMAGDPQPNDEPKGAIEVQVFLMDPRTGGKPDLPLFDLAMEIIQYGTNWKFQEIEKTMVMRTRQAEKEDDVEFLPRLCNTLLSLFLAMDGPRVFGWVGTD
jgi:hypothetical protein